MTVDVGYPDTSRDILSTNLESGAISLRQNCAMSAGTISSLDLNIHCSIFNPKISSPLLHMRADECKSAATLLLNAVHISAVDSLVPCHLRDD